VINILMIVAWNSLFATFYPDSVPVLLAIAIFYLESVPLSLSIATFLKKVFRHFIHKMSLAIAKAAVLPLMSMKHMLAISVRY
jgi:hypothetical protein